MFKSDRSVGNDEFKLASTWLACWEISWFQTAKNIVSLTEEIFLEGKRRSVMQFYWRLNKHDGDYEWFGRYKHMMFYFHPTSGNKMFWK